MESTVWRRSAIVNKTILLDAVPHTVIGVMPPSFFFWVKRPALDADLPSEKTRPDEDAG